MYYYYAQLSNCPLSPSFFPTGDYSEKLQKRISGLRLGPSKDEVRDVCKQILEYNFPKQIADFRGGGSVHKYFDFESDFPHIGIVS
ncbi:hypothetical protein IFM47457_08372 [Aspergillus lentulus]|nr:hypothetical protein IFM47457_08372 [Aspergillus lentulus]